MLSPLIHIRQVYYLLLFSFLLLLSSHSDLYAVSQICQVFYCSTPFACDALFLDASLAFFKSLLKHFHFSKVVLTSVSEISIYAIADFSYPQSLIFCLLFSIVFISLLFICLYILYSCLFFACIYCLLSASL